MASLPPEKIILIHVTCHEERSADVLDATKAWKLRLHLGFSGVYYFDIRADRLIYTEHSKRHLLWRAKDKLFAEQVWKKIMTHGVYQPEERDELKTKLAKAVDSSLREPSYDAHIYANNRFNH